MATKKQITTDKLTKTMENELKDLYRYAFYRLGDKQDAEDIIQDLYIHLYTKNRHNRQY